ncbi:MAG: leucine-rich repeat protein [Bacilli bacterium]|nr:leucine-rich repeat protein [Bacilli bacterium]
MCKAGIAFKNLDYETGIDYIYNIGGSVDVKYDNNGGNSEKGSETIKRARNYVDNNAEKSGYDFHGWLLTDYAIDSKSHYASINLEAQYNVITYNISYTLNGGSSSTQLPTTYSTEEAISIPNPTKEGYTFLGWTGLDIPTPTVDYVIPVGSIGNKSYIANWKANEYTIYLNPNGGTVSQQEVKVTYDSVYSLPTPNYNGYDFKGWFDSSSTKYSGGTYKVPSNLYLNASWEAHNYTISYNLNGGINDSRNPSSYKIVDSDIILRDPTRTGYTFIGWTCSQISVPTKGVKIESGTTGNLSFEANWQANTYNVTIDLNGGESDKASYSFVYDSTYSIVNPTRVGYSFEKFTYNGETVLPSSGTWKIADDITIKANWIANSDTPYIINYYTENLNGDGYTKVYAETSYGYSDNSVTLAAKTFKGFTPIKSSQTVTIAANGSTVVDFYYSRNSYTISFVTNGGSYIDSETYKYEKQIPSTLKATRAGYTFAGWYTDEKQTTLFDKMPASDQTVYAYYLEETKASFFTYTFSGQEVTITKGNGLSGSVVVPEYIAGKLVTAIGDNAFENCSAVTEITLSDSVDELGSSAFKGCSSLVRINGTSNLSAIKDSTFEGCSALAYFPDLSNVTSIGNNAFKGCSSLTTFTISDSLTSIGNYAFENCVMLLQTPDLTNVTSIGDYAFKGCTLLSEIKSLDGCATFGEGIFTACENIAKITLSFKENIEQFYVSSFFKGSADSSKYYGVTGKNGSIYYIPKRLTEIEYDTTGKTPDYFLYGLTSITKVTDKSDSTIQIGKHAFDGCTNLTDYSIQNSVVSLVDEYAFQNCTSLTDLPEFQLEEVKKYAFANCSALLAAPDIENTSYIGDYAFSGCSLITSIKNSNASYFGVNSLYGCSALEELEVPFVGTSINSTEAFGVIFGTTSYSNSYEATQLSKTYYIPSGLTKLTIGGNSIAAKSCVNLTSVTDLIISDSVESIGVSAFNGFNSLESITLPFVGESRSSTSAFSYVFGTIPSLLTSIIITDDLTIPNNAFKGVSNVGSITIPEDTASIGQCAFQDCTSLKRLNSDVDGVFSIPTSVSVISGYSFYNCSLAEKITLSENVTSIGAYAFANCSLVSKFNSNNATEMIVPELCASIGDYAFKGMALIANAVVPDSVESIGNGAFNGFNSLESITLPFVGESVNSTKTSGVFGYIFGYETYTNHNYGNAYNNYQFMNTKYNFANSVWQYTYDSNSNTSSSSTYGYVYYGYYIPNTLREVTITMDTTIPVAAFNNCTFLENIHLPDCVDSIGDYAFQDCSATVDYLINPTKSCAWDGSTIATSFHGGSGTQQDPYQIFSAKEFVYFLNQIRDGENYDQVYFVLTSNINLGGYAIDATALTESTAFKGTLDGNAYKLFSFTITAYDNSYDGLFGYVDGIIKNIGFETSMTITTSKTTDVYVGLIVGKLNGSLENVYATGTLTSTSPRTSYIGGLVGYNNGSILNSYANVNVAATSTNLKCYAAGLVGYNNGSITGSFAYGNVSAKGYADSYSYASGLVAFEGNNSSVADCYRYSGQNITKFGNTSTSYNNVGESASLEEIVTYCKANWNSSVWSYNKTLPSLG